MFLAIPEQLHEQDGKSKVVLDVVTFASDLCIIRKTSPYGCLELFPVKHFCYLFFGMQQALQIPKVRCFCSPQRWLLSQLLLSAGLMSFVWLRYKSFIQQSVENIKPFVLWNYNDESIIMTMKKKWKQLGSDIMWDLPPLQTRRNCTGAVGQIFSSISGSAVGAL